MNQRKNIILIGFMGSGKTTVGYKLSYRLRTPVEDTDKLIERREKKTINEIFKEDGEPHFRKLETELLEEIKERTYTRIISVGGGTPMDSYNRQLLKECGTVIYLRAKPETVYERIKHDDTRPLLQCEDPMSKIRELMEKRKEAYEDCADMMIDTDELTLDEIVEKLVAVIRDEGRGLSDKAGKEAEKEKKQLGSNQEKKVKKLKILVINGPNLNFLGIREKSVYGNQDYQYLLDLIAGKAEETGTEITVFQSNHEGGIIDRIQEAYFDGTQGIVINPGAYTHYSYAIRDALASITVPKVEIHISDITKREEFRKVSVTAPVCDKQIYGQGLNGYLQAIDFVIAASF